MKSMNRLGKWLLAGGAWTAAALTFGAAGAGCLARPVGQQPPTTKVNFTNKVSQQAVDKVDLLFAIDNSASMGDKQKILAEAVPNLLEGLLRPVCVDEDGAPHPDRVRADPTGSKDDRFGCPKGYDPEFKPVTDMHIGIVSSSLGGMGGDVCVSDKEHWNDRGHLLNRSVTEGQSIELAGESNFLAWFPQSPENADAKRHPPPDHPVREIGGTDPPTPTGLIENFQDLVEGVEQKGCGLEAQLESMYRFLIQPDPWLTVSVIDGKASIGEGVDNIDVDLLKQRAEFLRPDSLVAIIMLTDEDDSSADPLSLGGYGWAFMTKNFPGSKIIREVAGQAQSSQGTTAPRGTSVCDTDPASPDCTSCGYQTIMNPPPGEAPGGCDATQPSCQKINSDPNCTASPVSQSGDGYNGYYGPTDEELNVRFHRMKQRYGVDPQYPIKRYVDGLTKTKVPDRKAEHVITETAAGPQVANYTGTGKCTNPLFAAKLPYARTQAGEAVAEDYCDLEVGTRTPDLVFFAVVGGVPNHLLHFDPSDPEKSRITNDDWVKILGKDPGNFDLTGIDPHMIQSVAPRKQYGLGGEDAPKGDNGKDPVHGREWNTEKGDLQYACTFDLPPDMQRECDPKNTSCDCGDSKNPPLCDDGTKQVRAKAYPTIRELQVVRALGDQGVVASLCPIQLEDRDAPDYGYKPAMAAIIDRLKNALTVQCLPQKLTRAADKKVPCLVLAQLSPDMDTSGGCTSLGLEEPDKAILDIFLEQQRAESGSVSKEGSVDLASRKVCVVPQEAVESGDSCQDLVDRRWCYVENDPEAKKNPAGRCPQALIFSVGTQDLAGALFSLQCINQFEAGEASGDAPAQE